MHQDHAGRRSSRCTRPGCSRGSARRRAGCRHDPHEARPPTTSPPVSTGSLFLPQVILAIAGSLALSSLAGRIGLKRVLVVGLAADTLAMTLLVISNSVRTDAIAFPLLLVVTASLGLGFGLTLGSISTYAGAFQPTARGCAHGPQRAARFGDGTVAPAHRRVPRCRRVVVPPVGHGDRTGRRR